MVFKRFLIIGGMLVSLLGCSKENTATVVPPFTEGKFNLFPKAESNVVANGTTGWVGDVMPYYVDGQFEIFFLHDAPDRVKQSSAGEHDIHKFTSKNLLDFAYKGQQIAYGSRTTQDHLIGTGSMVKVGSTYYFYYTGHNGNSSWLQNGNPGWTDKNSREAVMYATSTDLNTWTKKTNFVLRASGNYSAADFRDPYVFYNDEFNEYWMLISTQQNGKSVLLVYKTDDPAKDNWTIRGPLNIPESNYLMMECADIHKIGNKYYLLFAEDWSNTPGTHYRVATSTAGPWVKPADGNDMFDGHQFYAGRGVSDGTNFYTIAWAHRRNPENDNGTRNWAGNLISHQFFAAGDDKLGVKSPEAVNGYFTKESDAVVEANTGTVSNSGSSYTLNGGAGTALYKFAKVTGTSKVQGSFNISNLTGTATVGFNTAANNSSTYMVKFEPAANRIAAYNNGVEVTRVPFRFEANKNYSFSVVMDGSVAVLYVNNQVALTNRIYSLQGNAWSLSADGLELKVTNLKVAGH